MLRRKSKLVLLVAIVLMLGLVVTGCGTTSSAPKEMKMSWNTGAEPKTLDPQMSSGIPEAIIELNLFEGLTRLDANETPQPAVATKWEISADQKVYTFHLRDSKWSNGEPVTANDFKFAWMRALDPANAAEYSYQLWYIKGGEAYTSGKGKAEDVGIKVIDNKTLEVTLEAPTPYFLSLTAFPTYMPVNEKNVTANKEWNLKPETFISNGPFKMQTWNHNDKIIAVKNDNYWDAKNVKLTELTFSLIEDPKSALTAFESGQLDGTDNIPTQDIERLKTAGTLKTAPYIGTYYYMFNTTKKPLDDKKVRQALSMSIDRKAIVEKVTKGGQTPAYSFVPNGMPDAEAGKDFRQTGGDYVKYDVEGAKKLLAEAGYADGKNFPEVTLLYNTSTNHQVIAEAIQNMWKTNLGINVKLTNQEWKVYLQSRNDGKFEIARAGWIGDYLDAMTFMDMWVSGGGNNDTGFANTQYDTLIKTAKTNGDAKVRIKAMHDAEKILMDEQPIMPIYYYTNNYVANDKIKGLIRSPLGFIDFKNVTLEK